tara:strand:+ start:3659 stop:13675 length:10017 start_codon:yes stop_codon:yes gene_type:complete
MKIPTKKFVEHQNYEKNDVVEVGPLSIDANLLLIGNLYDGMNNGPLSGTAFRIDEENDLNISFLLNKEVNSTTQDRTRGAVIFRDDQYPDYDNSHGVGGKISFYSDVDATAVNEIPVADERTHSLLGGGQISSGNAGSQRWIFPSDLIPGGTRSARICAVEYDAISLDFNPPQFSLFDVTAQNKDKFFYATQNLLASGENQPNHRDSRQYWTQDFSWKASYGSKVSFTSNVEKIELNDGNEILSPKGINSISMEMDLQFNNRTDKEARAILHFLQDKFSTRPGDYYKNLKGDPLSSDSIPYFKYNAPYPYSQNMRFICTEFNHEKEFANINSVKAKFINDRGSVLKNNNSQYYKPLGGVEDVSIYLDVVDKAFNEEIRFKKNVPVKFSIIGLAASNPDECKVIKRNLPNGTLRKIYLNRLEKYPVDVQPITLSSPSFRYVYLKEDLVLELDIEFEVVADKDFSINTSEQPDKVRPDVPKKTKFLFHLINPCNLSSEFMSDPKGVSPIGFTQNTATLTEQPSYVLGLPHSPRIQSSDISSSYKIRHKDGINADLVKPVFVYEKMDDQSTMDLLYFIESSLGYYPFRYVSPQPYGISFFNCTKWDHEFVYKNNHKITLDLSQSEVSPIVAYESLPMMASGVFNSGISISQNNGFRLCPFDAKSTDELQIAAQGQITIKNDSSLPNKIYTIGLGTTGLSDNKDVPFALFNLSNINLNSQFYSAKTTPESMPINMDPYETVNIPAYFSPQETSGINYKNKPDVYYPPTIISAEISYGSVSGNKISGVLLSGELACDFFNSGIGVYLSKEVIQGVTDFGADTLLSGKLDGASGNYITKWIYSPLGGDQNSIRQIAGGSNANSIHVEENGFYQLYVKDSRNAIGKSASITVDNIGKILDEENVSYIGFSGFDPSSFFMGAEGINLELTEFYPNLGTSGVTLNHPILTDTKKQSLPIWTDGGVTDLDKLGAVEGPRADVIQFMEPFKTEELVDSRGIIQIPNQTYSQKYADFINAGVEEGKASGLARNSIWEEVYIDIFSIGINEDNINLGGEELGLGVFDQKGCGEVSAKSLFLDGKIIDKNSIFCDYGDGSISDETISFFDYYPTIEEADQLHPGYLLHNVDVKKDTKDSSVKYRLRSFYKRFNEEGYGYKMVAKGVPISILREIDSDSVPSFFQSYFSNKKGGSDGDQLESYIKLALGSDKAYGGGNESLQIMHEREAPANFSPFSSNIRESFFIAPRGCGFFSLGASLQLMEKYFRQKQENPFFFAIPNSSHEAYEMNGQGLPASRAREPSFFYHMYNCNPLSSELRSINPNYNKFVDRMKMKFSSFKVNSNTQLSSRIIPACVIPLTLTTKNNQDLIYYYSELFNKVLGIPSQSERFGDAASESFVGRDRVLSYNFRNFTDVYAFSKRFEIFTNINKISYDLSFGKTLSSKDIPEESAVPIFAKSILNSSPVSQVSFHPTEKILLDNCHLDNTKGFGIVKKLNPDNTNQPAILQYGALSFNKQEISIDFPKYIQHARRSDGGYGDYVSPIGWHNYNYRAKDLYNYLTGNPTGSFYNIATGRDYKITLPTSYQFGKVLGVNPLHQVEQNTSLSFLIDAESNTKYTDKKTPLTIYKYQPYYILGVQRSGLNTGLLGNTGEGGVLDPLNDFDAYKFMVKSDNPSFPANPWAVQCYANEESDAALPSNLVDYMSISKISGLSYNLFQSKDTGVHEIMGKTGDIQGNKYGGNNVKNILELNYYNPHTKTWSDFRGDNSYSSYASSRGISENGLIFAKNGPDDIFCAGTNVSVLGNINTGGAGNTIGIPEVLTSNNPTGGKPWGTSNLDPGKIRKLGPTYDFLFGDLKENVRRRMSNGEELGDPLSVEFLENVGYYLTKRINNASEGDLSKSTKYTVDGISDYPLSSPNTYGIIDLNKDDKKSPNIFMRIYGRKVVGGRLVELYRGDISKKGDNEKSVGGGSFGFPSDVGYPRITEGISGVKAAGDYLGVLDTNERLRIFRSPHKDEVLLTSQWADRGLKVKAFDIRKNSMASNHKTDNISMDGINWEKNNTTSVIAVIKEDSGLEYLTGVGISGIDFNQYRTAITGIKQVSLGTHHFLAAFETETTTGITGFGNNSAKNAGALNEIYPSNIHSKKIKNICAGNYCSYVIDPTGHIHMFGNSGKNENASFPTGSGFNRMNYYTSYGFNDMRDHDQSGVSGIDERKAGSHCYVSVKEDNKSVYWWGGAMQGSNSYKSGSGASGEYYPTGTGWSAALGENLFKGFKGSQGQQYFKFVKSKNEMLFEDFSGFSKGASIVFRDANFSNTGETLRYNFYKSAEDIISIGCEGADPTIVTTGASDLFYGYNAYLRQSGSQVNEPIPITIVKTLPTRSVSYSDRMTGYSNFENTLVTGGPEVIFNKDINLGGITIDTTIPKILQSGVSTYYNQCLRFLIHRLDSQNIKCTQSLTNNIDVGIPLGWQTNPLRSRFERLDNQPLIDIANGAKGSAINFVEDLNDNTNQDMTSLQYMPNLGSGHLGRPILSTIKSINNNFIYPIGEVAYPVLPKEIGDTNMLLYEKVTESADADNISNKIKELKFGQNINLSSNKQESWFGELLKSSLYQYSSGLNSYSQKFYELAKGDYYKYSFNNESTFEMNCPKGEASGIYSKASTFSDSEDRAKGVGGMTALPLLNYVSRCQMSGATGDPSYFQTGYNRDGEYKKFLIPKRIDGFLGSMKRYYGAIAYDHLLENGLISDSKAYNSSLFLLNTYRQNANFHTLAKSGFKQGYLFNIADSGKRPGMENFSSTFGEIDSSNMKDLYPERSNLYNDLFIYNQNNEGGFTYSNQKDRSKLYQLKTFGLIPKNKIDYDLDKFYEVLRNNIRTGFSSARIIENFPGEELKVSESVIRSGNASYEAENIIENPIHYKVLTGSISGNYAPATINPSSELNLVATEGLYRADQNQFAVINKKAESHYSGYASGELYDSIRRTGVFWDNPSFVANNQRAALKDNRQFPFLEGFAMAHIHNFLLALEPKTYYPAKEAASFINNTESFKQLIYDSNTNSYITEGDGEYFDFDPKEIDLNEFQKNSMIEKTDSNYRSSIYQETNSVISDLSSVPFLFKGLKLNLSSSIASKSQDWQIIKYKNSDPFANAPRPSGNLDNRYVVIKPEDGADYGKIITDIPGTSSSELSLRSFSNDTTPQVGRQISPDFDLSQGKLYKTTTDNSKFYRIIMPDFSASELKISYKVGDGENMKGANVCGDDFAKSNGNTPNPIFFRVYLNGVAVLNQLAVSYSDVRHGEIILPRNRAFLDGKVYNNPLKLWIDIYPNNHHYNDIRYGGCSAFNCETSLPDFGVWDYKNNNGLKIKIDQV